VNLILVQIARSGNGNYRAIQAWGFLIPRQQGYKDKAPSFNHSHGGKDYEN